MAAHETVRTMTPGQMKEVTSAIIESIPTDLPFDEVQRRIGNKRLLSQGLRQLLAGNSVADDSEDQILKVVREELKRQGLATKTELNSVSERVEEVVDHINLKLALGR